MVSWTDVLPTLVEAGGGTAPQGIDGRSFVGVLRGRTRTHRDRIFTTHTADPPMNVYPARSIRTGDWKYILNLHPEFSFTTHIDLGKPVDGAGYFATWREKAATDKSAAALVTRYHERPAEELYDLRADPLELNNLAGRNPGVVKPMSERLLAWQKTLPEGPKDPQAGRNDYPWPKAKEEK